MNRKDMEWCSHVGRAYCLETYKSLQSKENLLDTALEYGDGDAILGSKANISYTGLKLSWR